MPDNPDSFVKAMLPFLADPDLSDADKIGLLGLGSWAWDKDHCWPTNAQIARRCGWLAKGKPSILKAKRTLRRLEAKGRIRRVVVVTEGVPSRPRIELIPPTTDPGSNTILDGSIMTHPRINNDPTQGQIRPDSRVTSDLSPGQNGTVPGSGMTHYIDSATDSNHRPIAGDEPAAPPTAARRGWLSPDDRDQLMMRLEEVRVLYPTLSLAKSQELVREVARWVNARLPDVAASTIARRIGGVTRRYTAIEVFNHFAGLIEATPPR